MNKKNKKVRILWNDARLFFYKKTNDISLTKMETEGYIEKENATYYIVKNILTRNLDTMKDHPDGNMPNFFYIPKAFVLSVNEI